MKKTVFILLGFLSLSVGIVGVFLPGLPTTPFLLLSASLFIKSSDKLYKWLISNKHLGSYITDYQKNKGLNKTTKILSISLMWTMTAISVFLVLELLIVKILITVLAITGTFVMGFVIPTTKSN